MTRLELRDVRKNFGALEVLGGVSFDVGAGEFVSILGPSGAGKSTLFQLLTGAIRGEGEMRFDGAPLDGARFAFMPQRDALMPWRRVIDNATLGLEVQGMTRRAARERVAPLFA
ncbi:MAG: ATP-binding cassette domain-containing protein, partial [Mesorhizobium sp.]